ncbi:DndE family protein [Mesorhizobium amorphae]|uniref:Uncharacterized protein n=1 Tax=Mesorhizobium amorphae CCNWGS0123 TaxID=1082933 RepID=G6YG83_9HYPH|nr:DndE family protein [Mesorhizobium amorphae]ANT54815.1 hypothetical protein A6B35_33135 [Mesorhizobium amorphae CCNWGS0123]EHH09264.1 hypothetical protein MEA186_24957 [Mesorhizobium amorphae CCNWGS0123]
MTSSPDAFQLGDIIRADFRTSRDADGLNTTLMKKFGFQYRYQPARLAIALSLRIPALPKDMPDGAGKPIKGDILFGSDEAELALWVALVVQHSHAIPMSRRSFQELVGSHWHRGMTGLSEISDDLDQHPELLAQTLLSDARL